MRRVRFLVMCLLVLAVGARPSRAVGAAHGPVGQSRPSGHTTVSTESAGAPASAAAGTPQGSATAQADDPDLDVNIVQPDFMLAALPTSLRLPNRKLAFRLTHRFSQPLAESGLESLFGMDSGAIIGLELRFGLFPGTQLGFYRTSDRTIQFFAQYEVVRQGGVLPFGLAAHLSVEGIDNFRDEYSPGLGIVLTREVGDRAAFYVEPFWVGNTDLQVTRGGNDDSTAMLGLGMRLRILDATYLVGEVAPRIGGHAPGTTHASIGIEKRAGGHLFQLTVANNLGTTLANVARGGPNGANWYLGFNLARKFY